MVRSVKCEIAQPLEACGEEMKPLLILTNLIAAVGLYFLGNLAVAAHQTHALSVYEELKMQHLLVESPDYNIEKRLSTMADGGEYSLGIAEIGSVICVANAIAIGVFLKKRPRDDKLVSN
jgi:hypothetical protein